MNRRADAVDGHGDSHEREQGEKRETRHGDAEEHRLDALVRALVVGRGIRGIDGDVIADEDVDRRHVVDLLHLHIEAGRERVALTGVGELRKARDALSSLQSLRPCRKGDACDSRVLRKPVPQRVDVS